MVIDMYSQKVLFRNDSCGGSNLQLEEEDAKVATRNMSRNGSICNVEVRYETLRNAKLKINFIQFR